jgi:hypothetical protein
LLGNGSLDIFPQQRIINVIKKGAVGCGDFYSVLPEVIKGGHVRTLRAEKKI